MGKPVGGGGVLEWYEGDVLWGRPHTSLHSPHVYLYNKVTCPGGVFSGDVGGGGLGLNVGKEGGRRGELLHICRP